MLGTVPLSGTLVVLATPVVPDPTSWMPTVATLGAGAVAAGATGDRYLA